ncbi:hypothetical protein [Shewanella aegiceratis]|uniref:hypothetical protein n=1 Tax=Shewanella aegiceratis TaxID=2864203 RepID=UPI001C65DDF8|nr:hypothetical protein [Shewanella aegiceratis]QYJ83813.1 hypothetical protein K0H80_07445 [Shewanella aegiceratis]
MLKVENIQIKGFHTCKLDGGLDYVRQHAPFRSTESGAKPLRWQWLSTGYYFWTDSTFFAHKWGNQSYNGHYAILECDIRICGQRLLDLVGNTGQQMLFSELMRLYQSKLERASEGRKSNPTVSTIIQHYREQALNNDGIFPFDAIKAQDTAYKAEGSFEDKEIKFTPVSREKMFLVTRQQLCLFEHAAGNIVDKDIVHPVA